VVAPVVGSRYVPFHCKQFHRAGKSSKIAAGRPAGKAVGGGCSDRANVRYVLGNYKTARLRDGARAPQNNEGSHPMTEATASQNAPYPVEVEAGKTYYYCTCGKSAKQPFCDGTHKGSAFKPSPFEATESKQLYFCGCRQSAKSPFCDGAHKKL